LPPRTSRHLLPRPRIISSARSALEVLSISSEAPFSEEGAAVQAAREAKKAMARAGNELTWRRMFFSFAREMEAAIKWLDVRAFSTLRAAMRDHEFSGVCTRTVLDRGRLPRRPYGFADAAVLRERLLDPGARSS